MDLQPTYDLHEVLYKIHCFAREEDLVGMQILADVVNEERKRYAPFAWQTIRMVYDSAIDIMKNGSD